MDSNKDDNQINSPSTPEDDFSLEDILAEYGGSLEHHLLRSLETPPEPEKEPEPPVQEPAPEKPPVTETPPAPAKKPSVTKAPPASGSEEAKIPPSDSVPKKPKLPPSDPVPEKPKAPPSDPGPEKPKAPLSDPVPKKPKTPPPDPVPEKPAVPPADPVPEKTKKLPPVQEPLKAPEPEPSEAPKPEPPPQPPRTPAPPTSTPMPGFIQAAERAPSPGKSSAPRARSFSLEDVVGSTVDAVMDEAKEMSPPPTPPSRKGLFSRKPLQTSKPATPPPPPEPEPEPIGEEPELWQASHDARKLYIRRKHTVVLPLIPALLPTLALILESHQVKLPYISGGLGPQCLFLLACLALASVSCRHVFIKGFGMLLRRRVVAELLVSLSVLAAALDCVSRLLAEHPPEITPYAAVPCLALVFAQWGVRRESKGNYDMLRAASVDDDPPYLVTDTPQGACKQRGSARGFFTTASRSDIATLWQTALLPVFLAAAIVFAALSSAEQKGGGTFLLNLSAILPAAATFSLPLCWALPWSKLSEHLQKTGCAVAGWSGAQKLSARKRMIVTDADLFPPGSVQLSGRKFFNETPEQAISLAASMARAAGSGLERLFNSLVRSEGGRYEKVDDFINVEGGWSGLIKGESVLMGSAVFMRKRNIALPADVDLTTGIFLTVDKELIAVFSVKYTPSENVDFALKLTQRGHIQPILCSRDPNITPNLIRRKFGRSTHLEYPGLTERIALSEAEKDRGIPRALLFREGMLPYAEAVAGSLRLCQAVRRGTAISLLGGWAGTLMTFYLTSLGAYSLLNPLALELFLLLWTLPVLLISDWSGRY